MIDIPVNTSLTGYSGVPGRIGAHGGKRLLNPSFSKPFSAFTVNAHNIDGIIVWRMESQIRSLQSSYRHTILSLFKVRVRCPPNYGPYRL